MRATPRGRSRTCRQWLAGAVLAALTLGAPASAEVLHLPVAPETLLERLAGDCPDCVGQGFLPCGSADVQYGQRFAETAMQGEPPRAYLLARAPVSAELVPLLSAESAASVVTSFGELFEPLRLIVVDEGWQDPRLLSPSGPAEISVDPEQQACFRDPTRGLGCCLGDGPRDQGCLPKADPPSVRLEFDDPASGERLKLRYPVGKGEITLQRAGGTGPAALYWCQQWTRAQLAPAR